MLAIPSTGRPGREAKLPSVPATPPDPGQARTGFAHSAAYIGYLGVAAYRCGLKSLCSGLPALPLGRVSGSSPPCPQSLAMGQGRTTTSLRDAGCPCCCADANPLSLSLSLSFLVSSRWLHHHRYGFLLSPPPPPPSLLLMAIRSPRFFLLVSSLIFFCPGGKLWKGKKAPCCGPMSPASHTNALSSHRVLCLLHTPNPHLGRGGGGQPSPLKQQAAPPPPPSLGAGAFLHLVQPSPPRTGGVHGALHGTGSLSSQPVVCSSFTHH